MLIESLLLPWWKVVIYIVVTVLTVRIAITLNINEWMKSRAQSKAQRDRVKRVEECKHAWTLHHYGLYSQCVSCHAFISNSLLVMARNVQDPDLLIVGEVRGVAITPGEGDLVATYWGRIKA